MQIHPHSKHPWGEATDVGSWGGNREARRECPSAGRLGMETRMQAPHLKLLGLLEHIPEITGKDCSKGLLGNSRTKTARSKPQSRDLSATYTLSGIL